MKDNRVLGRRGARELTGKEMDHVTGGIQTQTACTVLTVKGVADGDPSDGCPPN